jgi:Tol biopolymer transport system component
VEAITVIAMSIAPAVSFVRAAWRRCSRRLIAVASVVSGACTSIAEPVVAPTITVRAASETRLSGTVGLVVSPEPVVLVTDEKDMPISGVRLVSRVVSGNGTVDPDTIVTDRNGRARITWTLGPLVGVNAFTMHAAGGETVEFTANAGAGPLAILRIDGDGQAAPPGTTLVEPLTAVLQDRFGNPVSGAPVAFTVVAGGGRIDAATAVSDASGVAQAGQWTLGPIAGEQKVRVASDEFEATLTVTSRACAEPVPGSCANPTELAFARPSDGQLYRVRSDGSALRRLTSGGRNGSPAWSPDGRRIAFIHSDDPMRLSGDVWLMDADGSNRVRRTVGGAHASVTWSPDGKQLAASVERTSAVIALIPVDGGGEARYLMEGRSPVWSPDGRHIAFVIWNREDRQDEYLGVVKSDLTGGRDIGTMSGISPKMAWSPDGLAVLFTSAGRVHVSKADGSGSRQLDADGDLEGVDVSRDGKWLAVTLIGYSTPTPTIGFLPIQGGSPTVILRDAREAAWRP